MYLNFTLLAKKMLKLLLIIWLDGFTLPSQEPIGLVVKQSKQTDINCHLQLVFALKTSETRGAHDTCYGLNKIFVDWKLKRLSSLFVLLFLPLHHEIFLCFLHLHDGMGESLSYFFWHRFGSKLLSKCKVQRNKQNSCKKTSVKLGW